MFTLSSYSVHLFSIHRCIKITQLLLLMSRVCSEISSRHRVLKLPFQYPHVSELLLQPHFEGSVSHHSHSRKWDLGVLRDSRKLRTQLQGSKHLALICSLYHWKGLEVQMSKMAQHEPFGHFQHKLWSKKKGRESNSQFDSRPLKVENRPNPSACR